MRKAMGDIGPSGTLRHSGRYPEDLAVLETVAGKGKPVVTVLVAGRPLYANDLMNLSDSFVMAWLPGTEGKGVADVLFKDRAGFTGTLSFSWPKSVCQTVLNQGDKDYAPLFATGYGLKYGSKSKVGKLDAAYPAGGCGVTTSYPVFNQADRATWPLYIVSGTQHEALGADLNRVVTLPAVKVETTQVNTQQDGKLVTWSGAARLEAHGARRRAAGIRHHRRRAAVRHHRHRGPRRRRDAGGRRRRGRRDGAVPRWRARASRP
jgi:beta-glucosidase